MLLCFYQLVKSRTNNSPFLSFLFLPPRVWPGHFLCCAVMSCTACQLAEGARCTSESPLLRSHIIISIFLENHQCKMWLGCRSPAVIVEFFLDFAVFPSSPSHHSWHAANNSSVYTFCVNGGDQLWRRCVLVLLHVTIHSLWMKYCFSS